MGTTVADKRAFAMSSRASAGLIGRTDEATWGNVVIDMSMSLDGYIAAPRRWPG
jgi:hypothetical protein